MDAQLFSSEFGAERQAVRTRPPVRLVEGDAVPGFLRLPQQAVETHGLALYLHAAQHPTGVEQGDEAVDVGVLLYQGPVKPTGLVVLAVGVVVAVLGTPHFIAHEYHGHPQRQQSDRQEVLHLPIAQLLDRWILRRAFHTTVPAPIIVGTVTVVFTVRLVVLVVVGDQVVQGEAIVTRHEVDTLFGLAFLVPVYLGAAKQAVGKTSHRPLVATEKAADIVAEPTVPLLPTVPNKAAHLIQTGRIPRLGNEFRAGQGRV